MISKSLEVSNAHRLKKDKTIFIPPNHVIDQACLVHDCATGRCSFKERETTVTVEREKQCYKVKYAFVHSYRNHKYFLVNKFYLVERLNT